MEYLVTGASGFIGKRFVRKLLARKGSVVHFVMRNPDPDRVAALRTAWGATAKQAIPVTGDLAKPKLGIEPAELKRLTGKIDHVYHLAAIYDLDADAQAVMEANITGTLETVRLAEAIGAKCFHHVSSIAAAGLYEGVFREDMFDEAEHTKHPYFASKHEAERLVREQCKIPWRVYRPAMVVGDSATGEMDKIDGPYYFFKLIQKLRKAVPAWVPLVGLEGGRINIVPVDFVVAALDHLGHEPGLDGRCFHLTEPRARRIGDVLNIFAEAAHAPRMSIRVNAAIFGMIPPMVRKGLGSLTPIRRIRNAVMKDLGLPEDMLQFINYPTRFDAREAEAILRPAGITVPALEDYAWKLWDYWERHLDPDLNIDHSLRGRVEGRVVLVTGGSSGIGLATAMKLAEAGAKTIIVARDPEKLEAARQQAAEAGRELITLSADIGSPESCVALAEKLTAEYGGVDILVNNAGRSIRRGIESSYDRPHDFERTMRVNYFGALYLTLGLLPGMTARRRGHVINISSIGVLTNAPRFSAYVASKAALDAWTRCAASEFLDRGVEFTTVNMPLVRTPMIAPTKLYDHVPTLTPDEAADLIVEAIIHRPVRIATRLGVFGQILHAVTPRVAQIVANTTFRMFPDSDAAKGGGPAARPSADQMAFTTLLRGIHF